MTNQETCKLLFEKLDEIDAYERCIGKVQFDMECCAPEEGLEQAGADMAVLGKRVFAMTHARRPRGADPGAGLRRGAPVGGLRPGKEPVAGLRL